jgi:hypothetical protein
MGCGRETAPFMTARKQREKREMMVSISSSRAHS